MYTNGNQWARVALPHSECGECHEGRCGAGSAVCDYEAMKMFFVENQIPQVIGLAIDHLGVASFADEEGAEETEEYKAAEALSRTGVSALKEMSASRFHWL